jgi:hypothetical protein
MTDKKGKLDPEHPMKTLETLRRESLEPIQLPLLRAG